MPLVWPGRWWKVSAEKRYSIEFLGNYPEAEWHAMIDFTLMRKSKADGAWSMLKAMYNRTGRARLVQVSVDRKVLEVIDEIGPNKVAPQ